MSTSILYPLDSWSLGLVSTALYITYSTITSLYSVYYGPLSHIPGPKLRAFSKFPSILTIILGNDATTYPNLHNTYGPIVRIGPQEISYNGGAEAWKAIYGFKNQVLKDRDFYGRPLNGIASIFEIEGREGHARQRKILSHSFADKTLRDVEPALKGWVGKLMQRFEEKEGGVVGMVGL